MPRNGREALHFTGVITATLTVDPNEFLDCTVDEAVSQIVEWLHSEWPRVDFDHQDVVLAAVTLVDPECDGE